jgi:F5/8 type C domain-containing protein
MDRRLICRAALAALFLTGAIAQAQDKVPLKIELPKPLFVGTPVPVKLPNLEPARQGKRPDFMVPAGTTNLAAGKKVTSSDTEPVIGTLDLITDGDKAGDEGSWVELGPGKQWVQIDLGQSAEVYAILVWHFHSQARAYRGMVVQVSDDATFAQGVQTVFNSDYENVSGQGAGKDLAYMESYEGKLIDAKGVKGRYVRLYTNGNTTNKLNHYVEVEVFGKPAS